MNVGNDPHFIEREELLSEIEIQERVIKSYEKAVYENIGQILSLAKMQLFTIDLDKPNESQTKINNSGNLIGKAIHDLRYITKQLGPKDIIEKGFAHAIEFELDRINHSKDCETTFSMRGAFYRLDNEKELLVFGILQELLLDVLIDQSTKLSVKLFYSANKLEMKILYRNRYADFVPKGLTGNNIKLTDRLKLVDAELVIKSLAGGGTILIAIKR